MTVKRTDLTGIHRVATQLGLFPAEADGFGTPRLLGRSDRALKSPEEIAAHNRSICRWRFAFKKHRATRLHYDLRLEWRRVLISWAIPDGPSYCIGDHREAIEVEDHDIDNIEFEGVITAGRRGAGPVMLWDLGFWEPLPEYRDVEKSLRDGCLKFTLEGEKLRGVWTLRRRHGYSGGHRPIWELIKEPDSFARSKSDPDILKEKPDGVRSRRALEEIERQWNEGKGKRGPKSAPLFETEFSLEAKAERS